MNQLLVRGGRRLQGEVTIQGAKNSVLPILAATLLTGGQVALAGCPRLRDVDASIRILRSLGCRAGASTISELTALGVPALIVPSPYVTNNHQEKNARVLEEAGGASVLLEKDSSGQALFQAACAVLHDEPRRLNMERAMASLGMRDATERI